MKSCYCCTCPETFGGSDPYCRNHGHAGVRECIRHESNDKNQGVDEDGDRIANVQVVLAAGSWVEADKHLRAVLAAVST